MLPCVTPRDSPNYNILISSSENSTGEENSSDDQLGQIKDLPENLEACCVSDSEPEVNTPNACPNTIRKTVYITEDCVYCGKIRTISQVIPNLASLDNVPKNLHIKILIATYTYLFFHSLMLIKKNKYQKKKFL